MSSFPKYAREFITYFVIALAITLPVKLYVAQPFVVSGDSMVPTFENGEYLIVDELSYRFREPARGEIIIFRFPGDHSKFYIKRVIGLPNEVIEIESSGIFVGDGDEREKIDESYLSSQPILPREEVSLGSSEYFVMGDNRAASSDSRAWGPVSEDLIVGHVILRLLPLTKIDIFPGAAEK